MSRGAETKKQTARKFTGRVSLVIAFFVFSASALLARAVQLQVFNKDFLNQQADTRHLRTEKISAHRGAITDRHGEPLAISTPVDSVWANPKKLAAAVDRVPELARLLDLDAELLMRRITRSMDKEFVYLKRHLNPDLAHKVMALKLPGVNSLREYRRYYPAGEVTGHLVGFTNIDDDGQEGLELAFNHWLAGETGSKRVLKDRLGRSVENVASIKPPRHGKDLRSSIDLRLQYLAYRALKSSIQQHKAESGSIVILDIETGEVLAPGAMVTTLQQVRRLKVATAVPDTEIRWLGLGGRGVLEVDAWPGKEFPVIISFLSPAADAASRTFLVELKLDNRDGSLRPGMVSRVRFERRSVEAGIVIPLDALVTRIEGPAAYVVEECRASLRQVQIDATEGDKVLVRAGLDSGDFLVVEGQRDLVDGQAVETGDCK